MGMVILRRVLVLIPLLFGVSIAVFALVRIGRGNPAVDYLRLSQVPATPEAIAAAEVELGLDRPVVSQYLEWITGVLQGDFGRSFATGEPVLADVLYYLPNTLQLAGAALLLTIVFGLILGVWAAQNRDRWPDHTVRGIAFLGVSMPSFWFAFLLILLFSVTLGWLPPMGQEGLAHLIMPAAAAALMSTCINARLIRGAMLQARGERHVLFAQTRGLRPATVTRRHVLLNALPPVLTAVGMHLGELLGGALVVEAVFSWPGIGRYAVSAISNRDYPVLQCFLLLMVVIFVLANLIVDILVAWLDPRIRERWRPA